MELTYHRKGDYLFPNLAVQDEPQIIGKYGMLRRTYLKENRKNWYQSMLMSGRLNQHLAQIEEAAESRVETLLDSLNESYPENNFEQLSLSNVSAAMGTKFLQKSLVAVVFALVLILLYIALRFKNIGGLTGGMMAVLALVNDLVVVFGTFVLLRSPLDGNFIAAMLTILGYSINDTVVVYDRIRENRALMGKKAGFEELVNHSVNQSARRTLITTITTVMALGVMCIVAKLYGLDSIFTFAFPLMMGMVSGVYTSLCVSTSAWMLWSERKPKKKA